MLLEKIKRDMHFGEVLLLNSCLTDIKEKGSLTLPDLETFYYVSK